MSSAERQKRCSISAFYIQIIKPYLVYKPGLTAVGVRQGKEECNTVLNIPPPPDLGNAGPNMGHSCLLRSMYPDWCDTNTSPPPPLEKIGMEGGS